MTVSSSIVLGIASGIITSFILYLLSQLFVKIVTPWYQQLIYSGIDISGDWKTEVTNPSGNKQTMILSLTQKAGKISGILSISKSNPGSGNTEIKTFLVQGNIQDRFVNFIGINTNKKNLGNHSELLEVTGGGKKMIGKRTWYSVTKSVIESEIIEWER